MRKESRKQVTKKIPNFAALTANNSSGNSLLMETTALHPPRNNFILNPNPFETFIVINDLENNED
jgi:hypothetical protein